MNEASKGNSQGAGLARLGSSAVCELVLSTSPSLLASDSPKTKGLCESKQWSLPEKDETFSL